MLGRDYPLEFKVCIASRLHPRISDAFNLLPSPSWKQYSLNTLPPQLVHEDNRTFLSSGFQKFRIEKHGRYTGWPEERQIAKLAEQSGFMFVYASTALKNITASMTRSDNSNI